MLLLAAGSYLSQIMLLVGVILLTWICVRRNLRLRRGGRAVDRQLRKQQATAQRRPSGAPLADAPKEVLRWQASMFDLQRELKSELDTRIHVVQSLIRQADARIAMLSRLETETGRSPEAAATADATSAANASLYAKFGEIQRWVSRGLDSEEIAEKMGIPLAEVELSRGCLKPVFIPPPMVVTEGVTAPVND